VSLLERAGHPVRRLRGPLDAHALPTRSTLVVLDPDGVPAAEARAMARFVRGGGVLVGGGAEQNGWLAHMAGGGIAWAPQGDAVARLRRRVPETRGVGRVRSAGDGGFVRTGRLEPILVAGGLGLAAAGRLGRGRLVALADASPLQNRLLGEADNAAFALALAGPAARPVMFAESYHGYGRATGLAAIPSRWWIALAGAALSALAFMASRARRLGPPEPPGDDLAPPRRAYVDALAATLARTRGDDLVRAGAPVRAAARLEVARRAGIGADAGDEAFVAAARRLGLDDAQTRAVTAGAATLSDNLAAGTALARLKGGGR
jgi:hypothetical protein